jgi:hypothetical protein
MMRKLKWMYNPDPFATRKEVEQCQAQAVNKRRDQFAPLESTEVNPRGTQPRPTAASGEFADAPEVKMAGALRELAEDAIKQVHFRVSLLMLISHLLCYFSLSRSGRRHCPLCFI